MKKTILVVCTGETAPATAQESESFRPHVFVSAFKADAPLSKREVALVQTGAPLQAEPAAGQAASAAADAAQGSESDRTAIFGWNPLSWAGVQSLWQNLENSLDGTADELIVVADPKTPGGDIAAWPVHDIDRLAQTFGSSIIQLIQLGLARFAENGGGSLLLVLCEKGFQAQEGESDPLRAAALGAAQGFGEAMLQGQLPPPCRFAVLRDESAAADLLARQVCRLLDDWPKDSGKALRFTGRSTIFGRF